jgi:hypothetical protein
MSLGSNLGALPSESALRILSDGKKGGEKGEWCFLVQWDILKMSGIPDGEIAQVGPPWEPAAPK